MLCSANAAKRKNDKSQAPHLYLAKVFSANAAKGKNDKSHAPHLYLAKAFRTNAAKAKHAKSFASFLKPTLIGIEKESIFAIFTEKENKGRKMRVSKGNFLSDYR